MLALQPDLFTQQKENLDRVYSSLAPTILRFIEECRWPTFHMAQLTDAVKAAHPNIAPDSAGRILRQLRLAKKINYKVENRRASLYRILPTL